MSLSRRSFFRTAGAAGVGLLSTDFMAARGREGFAGTELAAIDAALQGTPAKPGPIKISSNENAYGPGAAAVNAVRSVLGPVSGRYPTNVDDLTTAIAKRFEVDRANVLVGTGSGEVINAAVAAFTSPNRPLVEALPTWESPGRQAKAMKAPVKDVPVDADLKLDLAGMIAAAKGAGLVFFCNPNNPTGTVRSATEVAKFVEDVLASSPATTILLDEAYSDFVVDPSYGTGVPLAMKYPRVIVTRTFSKVHGMAGLRVGYAIGHPDTLKMIAPHRTGSMNVLSAAAAAASIQDTAHIAKQRDQNRATLDATVRTFTAGGYRVSDSQGNFILVDVKRPAKDFREACGRMGVMIGRDFPPLINWARISIGTSEEMRVANDVFKKVLLGSGTTASR
ncbi:MAG: aminotransferase class I/II-fold pyridoxal phosphate-dependent enzyme [Acidobacteria bacterium]|nr:aminotransferase class I/II-fold pyridoxal phosphate-dependent enzyme [Acidobacteriota bacterium]